MKTSQNRINEPYFAQVPVAIHRPSALAGGLVREEILEHPADRGLADIELLGHFLLFERYVTDTTVVSLVVAVKQVKQVLMSMGSFLPRLLIWPHRILVGSFGNSSEKKIHGVDRGVQQWLAQAGSDDRGNCLPAC